MPPRRDPWSGVTCKTHAAESRLEARAPLEGQADCLTSECGRSLWWVGEGKRPLRCSRCAQHKRRAKRKGGARTLYPVPLEQSKQVADRKLRDDAVEKAQAAMRSLAPHFLAVTMRLTSEPRVAAELAGLDLSDAELKAAVKASKRKDLDDLRENDRAGLLDLAMTAQAVLLLRLLANSATVPTNAISKSLRDLDTMISSMGGYAESRFVPMTLNRIIHPPPTK